MHNHPKRGALPATWETLQQNANIRANLPVTDFLPKRPHALAMAIFFGYKTAEHILNSPLAPEFCASDETPARCGFVDDHAAHSFDPDAFEIPVDEPLDIVVSSRSSRRRRKSIRCHVSSGELPHGAYLEIAPDVFVASPALCLLQRSNDLSYAGRIKLAARFCGTYAPSRTNSRGFIDRPALATPDELRSFIELMPGSRGVARSLEAADWTIPNAASPMETEMVMPFYLPWRKGGYGLPEPTMNYELTLGERGRRMTGKEAIRIDAYWPDSDFGCEYQSEMFHHGDERYGEDIGRQLAAESLGKTIRMVTKEQLKNSAQLEYLAEIIASHIGVEFHPERGRNRRTGLIRDIFSD